MDFICEIKNNISDELCNKIIKKFNENPQLQRKGKIGIQPDTPGTGVCLEEIKNTREIHISYIDDPEWKEIDKKISKSISIGLIQYKNALIEFLKPIYNNDKSLEMTIDAIGFDSLFDKGYNVQRVIKNNTWHHDSNISEKKVLVGILYLNTIPSDKGGATEFINGRKVQPEAGKLLLYPASWHHIHRGTLFKDTEKYICTFSLYLSV